MSQIPQKTILAILIIAISNQSFSQPVPDTLWTRSITHSEKDFPWSIAVTGDDFVVAGCLNCFSDLQQGYAIKHSLSGARVWEYTLSQSMFSCVSETNDGGYVIGGWLRQDGEDAFLVKMTDTNDSLWTQSYGSALLDRIRDVIQLRGGGFLAVGYTESFSQDSSRDGYIIRTDKVGDTVWTKVYGGLADDELSRVLPTPDSGFVLFGNTSSTDNGHRALWLIKTNAEGELSWTRTYSAEEDITGGAISIMPDSGFVAVGSFDRKGYKDDQTYLVRGDAIGDTLWTKILGGGQEGGMKGADVVSVGDGDCVAAGTAFGQSGRSSIVLMRFSQSGARIWTRQYAQGAIATRIKPTPDGGYIFVGTRTVGEKGTGFYMVKTGPDKTPPPESSSQE